MRLEDLNNSNSNSLGSQTVAGNVVATVGVKSTVGNVLGVIGDLFA